MEHRRTKAIVQVDALLYARVVTVRFKISGYYISGFIAGHIVEKILRGNR
jgi:hypothetical protein